jgi:hypothetical protein
LMGEDIQIPRNAKRLGVIKRFRHVVTKIFFGQALDRMGFWRPPGRDIPLPPRGPKIFGTKSLR